MGGDDDEIITVDDSPSSDLPPNFDELVLEKHREIEREISDNIRLVGEKQELQSLEMEYFSDDVYKAKIQNLLKKYKYLRKTRPDGNCFYRAFAYSYFESLIGNKEEFERFRPIAQATKDSLEKLGFLPITLEDFHEAFMEALDVAGKENSADELHRLFNEQVNSDYVVVFLRIITSGHLRQNEQFFENFVEGGRSLTEFCSQEVEPMYKESDHIHIIALSNALNVGIRVRYMDRGQSNEAIAHDFPEGGPIAVHLLYRPGHYDILYPIENEGFLNPSVSA